MSQLSLDDLDELEIEIAPTQQHQQARLFLVDGNNLAYKAYFAVAAELSCKLAHWPAEKLPVGATSMDVLPTNAIHGFANMLFRLWTDWKAEAVVVAWDTKPVHRVELMEQYKAHRPSRPDALVQQFEHFDRIAEAFGCVNVRVEGWEADDVLGTLAKRAERQGIQTCVVTNDRDMFQLASEQVCIFTTPKGLADPVVYTPAKVEERYGVRPDQVVDYLGLKGDPGDGIPGVPGIGEKGASKLVAEHGSIERVLDAAAAMKPGKLRSNLIEFREQALASKDLATIRCDLELDCDPQQLLSCTPDRGQLVETLELYELSGLIKRLPALLHG